jgi:ribonuclease HII
MVLMKATPSFESEKFFWDQGYDVVVGIDEVGRGAFAGPVAAAAVVFSPDCVTENTSNIISQINDSKLLTAEKREMLSAWIVQNCAFSTVAIISVSIINTFGIHKATFQAFRSVLRSVNTQYPRKKVFVLADGFHIPYVRGVGKQRQKAIIKGDQKSVTIAAASIIAKVQRDALMRNYHSQYKIYNFFKNKGYGTKEHRHAIRTHGLSELHRASFDLVKYL